MVLNTNNSSSNSFSASWVGTAAANPFGVGHTAAATAAAKLSGSLASAAVAAAVAAASAAVYPSYNQPYFW